MDAMLAGEIVEERLTFPGGSYWRGAIIPAASETRISFQDGGAEITISQVDRQQLALPDAEGVYFKTDVEPSLRYFIEKDFPCVHPRAADALELATETFTTPEGFEERKQAI